MDTLDSDMQTEMTGVISNMADEVVKNLSSGKGQKGVLEDDKSAQDATKHIKRAKEFWLAVM